MSFASELPAQSNPMQLVPTAFKGRIRPFESSAKQWLYDTYHRENISSEQQAQFLIPQGSAMDLQLKMHFLGHKPWDDAPLFYIQHSDLKALLGVPLDESRFSYNVLHQINLEQKEISKKLEQASLELRANIQQYENMLGSEMPNENSMRNEITSLKKEAFSSHEISHHIESRYPLALRLNNAGTTLKMLPSRLAPGEWLSLKALKIQIYDESTNALQDVGNFTLYSDEQFAAIRKTYLNLEKAYLNQQEQQITEYTSLLAEELRSAYKSLAGKPYAQALDKAIYYPSKNQLYAEAFYGRVPLTEAAIFFYAIAALLFIFSIGNIHSRLNFWAIVSMSLAFGIHTFLLILRCYILQRPPVSNMFETVIYVPWIAVLAGFVLRAILRNQLALLAACITSIALLVLLKLANLNASMENVQAVLDSRYWLIIHVLMVVGSYGVFVLCGVLGHIYLVNFAFKKSDEKTLKSTGKLILQTMYVGLALLIPGTILGGIWAAESWGRFWDWDPKESWAFISSCVYLLWVHSYTFNHIRYFGLAVGSIVGLIAISFTWYGVNYILGTGFHSYGFGSGGEIYYYLYLIAEFAFLAWIYLIKQKRMINSQQNN